jgi:hypothetical protein
MAATMILPLNNYNKKPRPETHPQDDGVCAGASLTWLAHAMRGQFNYNPHRPESHLDLSKSVMKKFLDTKGTYLEKINAAAGVAGFEKKVDFIQQGLELPTRHAFQLMDSSFLYHLYYIIICGSHAMAATRFAGSAWYLLDNMHGLYHASTLKDCLMSGEVKNIIGWLRQDGQWTEGYVRWLFMYII